MPMYKIEITYQALVIADDERKAEDFVDDIKSWEDPDVWADEVDLDSFIPCGWNDETCPYQEGNDEITVGEYMQKLRDKTKQAEFDARQLSMFEGAEQR